SPAAAFVLRIQNCRPFFLLLAGRNAPKLPTAKLPAGHFCRPIYARPCCARCRVPPPERISRPSKCTNAMGSKLPRSFPGTLADSKMVVELGPAHLQPAAEISSVSLAERLDRK